MKYFSLANLFLKQYFFFIEIMQDHINFEKTFYKNDKKVIVSINIERLSQFQYRIWDLYHSDDGETFVHHGDYLRNNKCIYVIAKTFGKDNKLLLNNKRVKTEDFGTLTCYMIRKNIVIPCSLIDEAIEKC